MLHYKHKNMLERNRNLSFFTWQILIKTYQELLIKPTYHKNQPNQPNPTQLNHPTKTKKQPSSDIRTERYVYYSKWPVQPPKSQVIAKETNCGLNWMSQNYPSPYQLCCIFCCCCLSRVGYIAHLFVFIWKWRGNIYFIL